MASMGSIWPRTGWADGRAEPSWRWSTRRTSAKLWRSTASTSVLVTLKVCHSQVTVEVWAADGKHTVLSSDISEVKTKSYAISCSIFVFLQCLKWQTGTLKPSWRKPSRLPLMMEWCGSEVSPSAALRPTSSRFSQVNCNLSRHTYKCMCKNFFTVD